MAVNTEKIPGGIRVDGIDLMRGKCGCTSLAACCYSWTKIKQKDYTVELTAKMTTPDTQDNYEWGYTVSKDGTTVTVRVEDARDKEIFSGYIPPAVEAWEANGWEIKERIGDREDGVVWRCAMCKWLYKEDVEGVPFADLPDDWRCPKCNVPRSEFERIS